MEESVTPAAEMKKKMELFSSAMTLAVIAGSGGDAGEALLDLEGEYCAPPLTYAFQDVSRAIYDVVIAYIGAYLFAECDRTNATEPLRRHLLRRSAVRYGRKRGSFGRSCVDSRVRSSPSRRWSVTRSSVSMRTE